MDIRVISTFPQLRTCFYEHTFCLFYEHSYPGEQVQVILLYKKVGGELLCCRVCLFSTFSANFATNPFATVVPVYSSTSHI